VKAVSEAEVFRVVQSGKRRSKQLNFSLINNKLLMLEKAWKRLVTKPCFVGEGFTRKPPKFERFIRPMVKKIK
jgi:ribosome biogenesis protein NSA2